MSLSDSPTADFNPSSKPDKRATSDEKWTYLQKAVAYIIAHPEGIAGLGPAAIYMHTVVFDFCQRNNSAPTVQLGSSNMAPHLRKPEPPLPEQLHDHLVNFLDPHFENIYLTFESLHGLDLLAHYAAQFDQASASANQLDRVFDYLNRDRVPRNPDPKRFGKYGDKPPTKWITTVKVTVFDVWKNTILARLQQDSSKFTSALLDVIHQPSENREEDATLVKKILESLIMLDGHLTNPIYQSALYHDHFQSRFLSDWDAFCLSKLIEIQLSTDERVDDPSSQLKDILQFEIDRMAKYLPERTHAELLARARRSADDKNILL